MILLKKISHTSLSPEQISAMTRDVLTHTVSLDSDLFVNSQREELVPLQTELNSAFQRIKTSRYTATREMVDSERDDILVAIRLHIRAAIAQYMIDKTKASQAKVVDGILKNLDSRVISLGYDEESVEITALLDAAYKISGAVEGSGSTPLFAALATVQKKFDKVTAEKDLSGEFDANARPVKNICKDLTDIIVPLLSYIRTASKKVPVKFDTAITGLNSMIDRISEIQAAEKTREENAKKADETAGE